MTQPSPLVDILLATYNGAAHLSEQLQSLVNQTYPHWRLLVRDDGSSDQTLSLLEAFAQTYPDKVHILKDTQGKLGAKHNFYQLISQAQATYMMLCDQDDVWLPDKIEVSLERIQQLEQTFSKPTLVYTDLKVVNNDLEIIHESMWRYTYLEPKRDQQWNRLLTVNPVTGCTAIFNQSLKKLLTPLPKEAIMHDWWLALVACYFGKLDYIPQATILYRQHQNNVVGTAQTKKKKLHEYFNSDTLNTMRVQLQNAQQQAGTFAESYKPQLNKRSYQIIKTFSRLDFDTSLSSRFFLLKHDILKRDIATSLAFLFRI